MTVLAAPAGCAVKPENCVFKSWFQEEIEADIQDIAGNFPTQDQYISIIIAGLCVERAMPDPHSHEVKAGGGLAH